jgi:hypothetical protein
VLRFLIPISLQLYLTCPKVQYRPLSPFFRLVSESTRKGPRKKDMYHLDYVSCFLTILSTVLIGKRLWFGWIIAALNSLVVCVIGVQTAQYGFLPGNLLCIVLYAHNLTNWRPATQKEAAPNSAMRNSGMPNSTLDGTREAA